MDVWERINVSYTNGLCECIICHYWYSLAINFRFPSELCDQGFRWSEKVREIVKGSGKTREIRYFLERVREENFYPCRFLTSIKKSLARGNVFSSVVYENHFYI